MSTLTSRDHLVQRHATAVNKASPEFKSNVEEWQGLLDELKERLKEATGEGKEKSIALHRKRGQLSGKYFFFHTRIFHKAEYISNTHILFLPLSP